MRIESIIRRPHGTIVEIGDRRYDFQPEADGRHVCDVTDACDADLLLLIKEGYRCADVADVAMPAPAGSWSILPDVVEPDEPHGIAPAPADPVPAPHVTADTPRETLERMYKDKFGERPHPAIKTETLVKRINEPSE